MRRNAAPNLTHVPAQLRRALAYTRVSTEEQAQGGVSLQTQEQDILRYAAQHDIEIIEVIRDEGFSAFSRKKRPGFARLLNRIDECDLVLVWKTDRFGRRNRELQVSVGDILDRDKGFISVQEGFDLTTPIGRLMFNFAAALAQYEPENLQTRILPNVQKSIERGLHHGKPPYGYRMFHPNTREVISIDPVTGEVVRRIFADYAAGTPIHAICKALNVEEVQTYTGTLWRPRTIRDMLRNDTYIGRVRHTRSDLVTEGLHPAIIDVDTWDACQRRIRRCKRVAPKARSASLAPLLRCGYCGERLYATHSNDYPAYACQLPVLKPDGVHPPLYVNRQIIHGYIWDTVELLLTPQAEMQHAIQWSQQNTPPDTRLAELRKDREQIEENLNYLLAAAVEAKLPHAVLAKQTGPLQERLAEVEALIDELEAEEPRDSVPVLRSQLQEAREKRDCEAQQNYLGQLFSHVTIYRESLVFHFRESDVAPLRIRRDTPRGPRPKDGRWRLPVVILE